MGFLKGYRSYIVGALIFLLGGFKALGWVDEDFYQSALAILLGAGAWSIRAAIK